MTFDIAVERVLGHEGGYVNHPADPGGETNWGVTIGTARENGYAGSMKSMTRQDAINIYRAAFWNRNSCDLMPFAVAFQVFDGCVNHGSGNAVKWLQKAVGATPDGVIGKQTLGKVNETNPRTVILNMMAERMTFYTSIRQWDHFGRGWINRMAGNARYAALDLA